MHVAILETQMSILFSHTTWIAALQRDKAATKIPAKFVDVFLFDPAMKLPKNTSINKHAIKLVESK